MPDQVVPITGLDQTGVILDTPPVALPPNAFTNAKNVRFKDGAVRKMEGEVDIFSGMAEFFNQSDIGALQYIAWWPSPNQTTADRGYYIFIVENTTDSNNTIHDIYAMLPGAQFSTAPADKYSRAQHYHRLGTGYARGGKWQHTLFNGGFTFIINNGEDKPLYVTDSEGNTLIERLSLSDLPGWDSYRVNELLLRDTFLDTSSRIFDTGQVRISGETSYVIERTRSNADLTLMEGTEYTVVGIESPNNVYPSYTPNNLAGTTNTSGQDVIVFNTTDRDGNPAVQTGDMINIRFQSDQPVLVSAAIVRAFGDFLVAGNLEEYRIITGTDANGMPTMRRQIIRRLTGVIRTSDVAQPGAIPNNWNPFAAGVSTADEFVIADTGTVQDMVALQGNMYLYTNTSISVMRLTGNANVPLSVQPVTDQYGALTTDAVLEYDGKHFVIGSDDIYLFGGHPGSIQSISDQKVRRSFFNRVNPINDNTRNLFTLRYAARDEIWICFPTIDSVAGESDEAYIWNYRNGTWTIRTLNSVVRGDVGPIPGGGVPSAVIRFTGDSGTDDIITVGSREVQTIEVGPLAMVGHASAASEPEQYTYETLETAGADTRPALTLDAAELVEVSIGSDFYSGPNPVLQQYDINSIPNFTAGDFTSGGARFRIEYEDPVNANTGNDQRIITVHANELGFTPGSITGTQFATALATHLDGLTAFDDWTITSNANTLSLVSDLAGRRELIGLSITTYTTMVNTIMDTGPFTPTDLLPSRTFRDNFGDELFTVTRLGTSSPYTFSVSTNRNTGFNSANDINQLAFITDGDTFTAPDPFNAASGTFTFPSTSGTYEVRSTPPANFTNLAFDDQSITNVTAEPDVTQAGVTLSRDSIQGGYTRTNTDSSTPLMDTNEGVIVTVADTTIPPSTTTGDADPSDSDGAEMRVVPGNAGSISVGADSGIFLYPVTASSSRASGQAAAAIPGGRYPAVNGANTWGSRASDAFIIGTLSSSVGTSITNPGFRTIAENAGNRTYTVMFNGATHTIRCCTTRSGASARWDEPNVGRSDGFVRFVNMNLGGIAPASVGLSFQAGRTDPTTNDTQFGRASSTTVRLFYPGYTDQVPVPAIPRRSFTFNNTNSAFDIEFSYQGGTQNVLVAAGTSETRQGTTGSSVETWRWNTRPISVTGTSIGGSGTDTVASLPNGGLSTITRNGVTVTVQNTSTPEMPSTMTGNFPAVLAPASNGNSLPNPQTFTFTPTQEVYRVNFTGRTDGDRLGVYRLTDGSRVGGGGGFGLTDNPPGGWVTTGFESGQFQPGTNFAASNIDDPVNSTRFTTTDGGTATTAGFGTIGIRQRGTAADMGPAVALVAREANRGSPWNSNSAFFGNLIPGNRFNGVINFFSSQNGTPAEDVRVNVFGPRSTYTIVAPRESRETYTVRNDNPFDVILTAGSGATAINRRIPANQTVSGIVHEGEATTWTVANSTDPQYQFTVTNNNIRALVSGTLTHGTQMIDLTDLAVGASMTGTFSTTSTASVTFRREIEQTMGSTVVTPANLVLRDPPGRGIGTTPTAISALQPVMYSFMCNFTDDTPDINIVYTTERNTDPDSSSNQTNVQAIQAWVRRLLNDTGFNTYFMIATTTAITENGITTSVDSEIPTNAFRVEARAIPGETIPGTSLTMPEHDAIVFDTPINQQDGGNAAFTTAQGGGVEAIQRGSSAGDEPIVIGLSSGIRQPGTANDGSFTEVEMSTPSIVLRGSYPAGATGSAAITEAVRNALRLDMTFTNLWNTTSVEDSSPLNFTSGNNGPHYIRVASVTPTVPMLSRNHFNFQSTRQGIIRTDMPTYPTINLLPPIGEAQTPIPVILTPLDTQPNTRLGPNEIAAIIRARFTPSSGWALVSTDDSVIGTAPEGNQIRIARTTEGVVNSGTEQSQGWRVSTEIDYGNTGRTLPGTAQTTDGTVVGRLEHTDFIRADTSGIASETNPLITATGMGDRLDFRGSRTERSQPTRVMVQITNPDIQSMDPVFDLMGNLMRNDDGSVRLQPGNTQYIAIEAGGAGNYTASDQTGNQPGTRVTAAAIVNSIESRISTTNRRVSVDANSADNSITIIPRQYSGLANFVVAVFLNDSRINVDRWNAIVAANAESQTSLAGLAINTMDNDGIQSTVPTPVDSTTDQQFNPGNRIPNFANRNIVESGLIANMSDIDRNFDPLRPWPTTQVNLNREYPIFTSTEVDTAGLITRQTFRSADIGFLYLDQPYESFVERIEMAITPEFDTEQIQSLALWGDGGSQVTFGQPINQATLNVRMYGTNAPGSTLGMYTAPTAGEASNEYIIGDDYKIDMRVHGRFLNVRISDMIPTTDGTNPNVAVDEGLTTNRGISWNVSGMQADIVKGGRR